MVVGELDACSCALHVRQRVHIQPLRCLQAGEFKSARLAVSSVLRREGARGMFAGYGAFLIRDLPFDAIEFWAYDTLKRSYTTAVGRDLNGFEAGGCGAIAGAVTGAQFPLLLTVFRCGCGAILDAASSAILPTHFGSCRAVRALAGLMLALACKAW